jgi:hypothetical protein
MAGNQRGTSHRGSDISAFDRVFLAKRILGSSLGLAGSLDQGRHGSDLRARRTQSPHPLGYIRHRVTQRFLKYAPSLAGPFHSGWSEDMGPLSP